MPEAVLHPDSLSPDEAMSHRMKQNLTGLIQTYWNQVSTKSSHSIEDFRLKASLREHRLACRKRTNNESRDSERHGRNIPFHVNQTLQPCRPVHVPYKDNETKLNPMSKSGMSTLLFQENQHRTSFSHQARKYKP